LTFVTDANLAKRVFSATLPQNIFATAVTAGNNAVVTITVIYEVF
jgi:hypothetical protein